MGLSAKSPKHLLKNEKLYLMVLTICLDHIQKTHNLNRSRKTTPIMCPLCPVHIGPLDCGWHEDVPTEAQPLLNYLAFPARHTTTHSPRDNYTLEDVRARNDTWTK